METPDYESAITRAWEGALKAFGRPLGLEAVGVAAERWMREAAAHPLPPFRYRHPANAIRVLHRLLRLGYELRRSDPARYLAVSQAAVRLAGRLEARGPHGVMVEDLRGEAWMHLGNARRLHEKFTGASSALYRAKTHVEQGTGDCRLRAEAMALEASLRRDQGDLESPRVLLAKAIELYEECRESALASQEQLTLGVTTLRCGKPAEALSHFLLAGRNVELIHQDWHFGLGCVHNTALAFAELGAIQRAVNLLSDCLDLYEESGDEVLHTRVAWVVGRILAHRDDWTGAAEAFNLVRTAFTTRGLAFDASLAGLELALAYLKLGLPAEVRALAEEMLPVFVAKAVPKAASAALLLFVEAARREAVDAEAVATLLADLKGRLAPAGRRGSQGRFLA